MVNTTATPLTNLLHDLDLVVLVKESGIVSPLLGDNTRDADYIPKMYCGTTLLQLPVWKLVVVYFKFRYFTCRYTCMEYELGSIQRESGVYVFNPENNRILQVIQEEID